MSKFEFSEKSSNLTLIIYIYIYIYVCKYVYLYTCVFTHKFIYIKSFHYKKPCLKRNHNDTATNQGWAIALSYISVYYDVHQTF